MATRLPELEKWDTWNRVEAQEEKSEEEEDDNSGVGGGDDEGNDEEDGGLETTLCRTCSGRILVWTSLKAEPVPQYSVWLVCG